ncbi:11719_t:CDS:2 [Scutellospora calospora]|uniref:11719_t:CDS:1 n=1 Tax=Scutellospora calospora TaxID=85575 RepID=A0ACA9NBX5_9GLOM|nr:11719_t:CDS:2 [Scutellospora calospora]
MPQQKTRTHATRACESCKEKHEKCERLSETPHPYEIDSYETTTTEASPTTSIDQSF